MGFFESDIVQEEAKKLFTDYQELMKLGSDYGKFDREGKKIDWFSKSSMILAAGKTDQFFFHWKLYLQEELFGANFYCEYLLKF